MVFSLDLARASTGTLSNCFWPRKNRSIRIYLFILKIKIADTP